MNPCQKCGTPTDNILILAIDGEDEAMAVLCRTCTDMAHEGFEVWKRRFEMLLANGVSRKRANEILIDMMNRGMH